MSNKIISDRVKRVAAAVMLASFGITTVFSPVAFAEEGGLPFKTQDGVETDKTVLNISNLEMKKALNHSLGRGSCTDDITIGDMRNITDLTLYGNSLINMEINDEDLAVLKYAVNIESLSLAYNNIQDVSPLREMKKLTYLHLYRNKISDISPLEGLVNLKILNLGQNKIRDISPVSHMVKLERLSFFENDGISDITPLRDLTEIKDLNIGDNNISDISVLENMTNLEDLDIEKNKIADISPLRGLHKLRKILAYHNQISDVSPLSELSNLSFLYLGWNKIGDVSPLKNLDKLVLLDLQYNQIQDFSILEGVYPPPGMGYNKDPQNIKINNLDSENLVSSLNIRGFSKKTSETFTLNSNVKKVDENLYGLYFSADDTPMPPKNINSAINFSQTTSSGCVFTVTVDFTNILWMNDKYKDKITVKEIKEVPNDLAQCFESLPEGTKVEKVEQSNTALKVKVTFKDNTSLEKEVPINKKAISDWEAEMQVLNVYRCDSVDLLKGLLNAPSDAKVSVKRPVRTDTLGIKKGILSVLGKDGLEKDVEVKVNVLVNPKDIVAETVNNNEKVNLVDNIKHLPEGTQVKELEVRKDEGKVEIILPSGEKQIVTIPIKRIVSSGSSSSGSSGSYIDTERVKENQINQDNQIHIKEYAQFIIDAPYYHYIKGDHQRTVGMTGKAYIKEGRTMLPMRFVAYTLGMDVSYDDRTRTATFVNNDNGANALSPGKLVINIDTGSYRLYDEKGERYALQIDIPKPDNVNGHIYFPVSRVAALFGASQGDTDWKNTIVWHDKDRVVNIFKDVK